MFLSDHESSNFSITANKFRRNLKWKIVKDIIKSEEEEYKLNQDDENYFGSPWRVSKRGNGLTYKFNEDRIIIKEECEENYSRINKLQRTILNR